MSMAELAAKLNRRHKAALCGTLVFIGLIVLLGGGIRAAVGIGLLGIAFSWALGSNHQVVHWLFLIFGLLLLILPTWDGISWPQRKLEILNTQTELIEIDRNMVKDEPTRYYEQLLKDQQELRTLQREDRYRHVAKNDWGIIAGGLLLFASGVGLIVGMKPITKS